MNFIFFILIIIIFLVILYYYAAKTSEPFNIEIPKYTLEYSCKFSAEAKYNDTRYTMIFNNNFKNKEGQIFDKFKIIKPFRDFYNNNKKNPHQLAFGFDKQIGKIYYNDDDKHIYGIAFNNNKFSTRIYKPTYNIDKKIIDEFIGTDKSTLLFKLFNITNNLVYVRYENNIATSYHFCIDFYTIKNYNKQIKELLTTCNCNISNIDVWINKNQNKYIRWIGITNTNNKLEITIYYRIEIL